MKSVALSIKSRWKNIFFTTDQYEDQYKYATWKQYLLPNTNVFVDQHKYQVVIYFIEQGTMIPKFIYMNNRSGIIQSIAVSPSQDKIAILENNTLLQFSIDDNLVLYTDWKSAEITVFEQSNLHSVHWNKNGIFVTNTSEGTFQFVEGELKVSDVTMPNNVIGCSTRYEDSLYFSFNGQYTTWYTSYSPEDGSWDNEDRKERYHKIWQYDHDKRHGAGAIDYQSQRVMVPSATLDSNQSIFESGTAKVVQIFGQSWILTVDGQLVKSSFPLNSNAVVLGDMIWSCDYDGCDYGGVGQETPTHMDYQMLFTLNDRLILLYSMTQNKMSIREGKSGAELAVITRPDTRVIDVNISMDEQWLFVQSSLGIYVYSIQDGSLHETCSLIYQDPNTCTFGQYREWGFPFGELMGDFSNMKYSKYSRELDLYIWNFNGVPNHESMWFVKERTYEDQIGYTSNPDDFDIPFTIVPIQKGASTTPMYFQYARDGSAVRMIQTDEIEIIDVNGSTRHIALDEWSIHQKGMWSRIADCEAHEESSDWSTVFEKYHQDPDAFVKEGLASAQDFIVEEALGIVAGGNVSQYSYTCTRYGTTHFQTRDWREDSVLLKQDLASFGHERNYSREREYISEQTIYAYRSPPSHQAYYEQTNRFSLERICPSTLQVVKVKPTDQNLDSAFVPKRLWATYCE